MDEPSITLPGPDNSLVSVKPQPILKWLGFFLDSKLNFTAHVRHYATKAKSIVMGYKMLGNTRRGLSQAMLRRIYIACVLLVATYGSVVWWSPDRQVKSHAELIQSVQREKFLYTHFGGKGTPPRRDKVERNPLY